MIIDYQPTAQEEADLAAKAGRETTIRRPVTAQSLLQEAIVNYCMDVARENGTSMEARMSAWFTSLTPAQEAAFLTNQGQINTLVGKT